MVHRLHIERSRMIEKPNISDEKIIIALDKYYSIQASEVKFLPIGNDSSAFAYRVETKNHTLYFLKIKKGISNPAGLFVPRFLKEKGIAQVLAPLPTRAQELSVNVDEFVFILYPFILGNEAMEVGMSDNQWTEFGSVLKEIHFTRLPSDIARLVRREDFVPKWSCLALEMQKQVDAGRFDDLYQKELAVFWKDKKEIIQAVIERAELIGKNLQQADLEFVLCHADIHTANILITNEQNMFIVDWDDTLFAPKERDLMHVLEENRIHTREERIFFAGYGDIEINPLALAYYRYEWCVQEIGDFGERVFLTKDIGERTSQDAVDGFMKLFSQGDVIEAAFNTPFESEIRNNS
jgi:spectinomycin phosphotransferase